MRTIKSWALCFLGASVTTACSLADDHASVPVNLAEAADLTAGCTGTPLLEQGLIDRTPQAAEPGFALSGAFESSVRRCTVGSGCTKPITVKKQDHSSLRKTHDQSGRWKFSGWSGPNECSLEHDGTTGKLAGATSVQADDGRTIRVDLEGAATTGCISFAGSRRVEVDAVTYYDVSVTFTAPTPPVAPRIAYPATPPPAECEGQPVITDAEVLARFSRGASSVELGKSESFATDWQWCHAQTGCSPWKREVWVNDGEHWKMSVSANLITASTIGITLSASRWSSLSVGHALAREESGVLKDGRFAPAGVWDVLHSSGDVAQAGSISDTHVFVRDVNLTTARDGDGRASSRLYACIPIIARR
jgi:hypothetical protein